MESKLRAGKSPCLWKVSFEMNSGQYIPVPHYQNPIGQGRVSLQVLTLLRNQKKLRLLLPNLSFWSHNRPKNISKYRKWCDLPKYDWYVEVTSWHVECFSRRINDLIYGLHGEVESHELNDRPQTVEGRSHSHARKTHLSYGSVDDTLISPFPPKSPRYLDEKEGIICTVKYLYIVEGAILIWEKKMLVFLAANQKGSWVGPKSATAAL